MKNELFLGQIFEQKCGDNLKVLNISEQKDKWGKTLYECEFLKYPFKILAKKNLILKGTIVNPQIEIEEFFNKEWVQNCGDTLKILSKTNEYKGSSVVYKCLFVKYPCEVFALKDNIKKGKVLNPLLEQVNFLNKEWSQNCGDILRILNKTEEKDISGHSLFHCDFIKYPCEILATKDSIILGRVDNPNLPWKTKENLEKEIKYFLEKYNKKPSLKDLSCELGVSISTISRKIIEYDLKENIAYFQSQEEDSIKEFVKSLGVYCSSKSFDFNLKYKEIDIYIPSLNIGFEFNGNYWHSELYKDQRYHQEKIKLFKEQNIRVFNIFEYEFLEKRKLIEEYIKQKLGIYSTKIFARKCIVKEINTKEYQEFCQSNHLQGSAGAKIKLGLFYKEELVQILSLGSPRFTDIYEWEIIRECSKVGYKIIGGKSKLWNYFLKNFNPKNCVSYCDFSKFDGESYIKLGFVLKRLNKPGFVWWDEKINQTFWRSPKDNNEYKDKYLKIYDCGQLVFEWSKNK